MGDRPPGGPKSGPQVGSRGFVRYPGGVTCPESPNGRAYKKRGKSTPNMDRSKKKRGG